MVQRHFDKVGVNYITKYLEVKGNVTTDTIEYAESVNADMIAIMTEQESTFSNLLMGTFAQQMITQSKIPVLTVRPRQVLADHV
jgi:nucleotide-binding universal stress UspA family protein